jgi:hypothetical protein
MKQCSIEPPLSTMPYVLQFLLAEKPESPQIAGILRKLNMHTQQTGIISAASADDRYAVGHVECALLTRIVFEHIKHFLNNRMDVIARVREERGHRGRVTIGGKARSRKEIAVGGVGLSIIQIDRRAYAQFNETTVAEVRLQ